MFIKEQEEIFILRVNLDILFGRCFSSTAEGGWKGLEAEWKRSQSSSVCDTVFQRYDFGEGEAQDSVICEKKMRKFVLTKEAGRNIIWICEVTYVVLEAMQEQ